MRFLYLLLMLISFNMYSQSNFEGIIKYEVEVQFLEGFKKLGMSENEYLKKLEGREMSSDGVYFIYKNGNYIITPKLKSKFKQLYLHKTNNIYIFEDNLAIVSDASVDIESAKGKEPTVELLAEESMVNNVSCRVVKITWESGTYWYYYNSDFLNIDATLFKLHTYDMWNKYIDIAKCLPLKIVKEVKNFSVTILTAKTIEKKEIKDSTFDLPKMKEDSGLSKYKQHHQRVYVLE